MLKVVVDTSVFIAGLLTKNPMSSPAQIIEMWRNGEFTLVMSPHILRELVAKMIEKDIPEDVIVDFVSTLAKLALHVPGAYETQRLTPIDPDDNMFLAAALEAGADYIVSCDKKSLLPLKHFHGTQIRTPELFLRAVMGLSQEEAEDEELQEELTQEREQLRAEARERQRALTEPERRGDK